jgi:Domain of unknown function (DUF222)
MPDPATNTLERTAAAVAALGNGPADFDAMSDDALLEAQRVISAFRKHGDTRAAWCSAAIARRSTREMGYAGLAQRKGFATPEALIQSQTGSTRTDAVRLVAVGTMMAETEAAETLLDRDPGSPFAEIPWLAPVARAVGTGTLSIDGAEAIRKGLGDIDPGVPAGKLQAAAEYLLGEAGGMNADQLLRLARRVRDELDQDGIARRAKTQHDARSFKIWRQADGMYRMSALLDAEDGRFVQTVFDQATSPRRGGPRFVDAAEKAQAEALKNDERCTEQIAADAFLALLRLGVDADPCTIIIGRRRPAVRVVVTEKTLKNRAGIGRLEGHPDPVPFETVERQLCDSGQVGVKFDDDG